MKPTVLYLLLGFVFHPLVVGRGYSAASGLPQ
jgi:hypothetical protein